MLVFIVLFLLQALTCEGEVTKLSNRALSCGTSHLTYVTCSSWKYRFKQCAVPTADQVTNIVVAKKFSRSACTHGYSYGFYGNSVWVNRGCRAKFAVCHKKSYCRRSRSVKCSSWGYKFKLCYVYGAVKVTSVRVTKQYSKSACRFGHSFGVYGKAIWVHRGCRAKFSVCYV